MTSALSGSRRSPWQVQRAVLYALVLRELKTRFGGRWFGALWVLAEPLVHVLLLLMLLGAARHRLLPGIDFVLFLVTGLLPFFMFRNLALRSMDAIDANRGLFGYRQVRPIDALLARAILEVALYSVVYLLVLALLGWGGYDVLPARPLEVAASSAALLLLGLGIGLTLAVATDALPQARGLVRIAFFPLYLLSGVIFPIQSLPGEVLSWLLWNPVLHALEVSRGFFFVGYRPVAEASGAYVAACAIVCTAFGLSLYRVRRQRLLTT
ncbi:MAG: ABC transporter permease [Burkholderiaceae bacterium]